MTESITPRSGGNRAAASFLEIGSAEASIMVCLDGVPGCVGDTAKSIQHLNQNIGDHPLTANEEKIRDQSENEFADLRTDTGRTKSTANWLYKFRQDAHEVLEIIDIHLNILIQYILPDAQTIHVRDLPEQLLLTWRAGILNKELEQAGFIGWISLPAGLCLLRFCCLLDAVLQFMRLSFRNLKKLITWAEETVRPRKFIDLKEEQFQLRNYATAKLGSYFIDKLGRSEYLHLHNWTQNIFKDVKREGEANIRTAMKDLNKYIKRSRKCPKGYLKEQKESEILFSRLNVDEEDIHAYRRCIEIHWKGALEVYPDYIKLAFDAGISVDTLVPPPERTPGLQFPYYDRLRQLYTFDKVARMIYKWEWILDPQCEAACKRTIAKK